MLVTGNPCANIFTFFCYSFKCRSLRNKRTFFASATNKNLVSTLTTIGYAGDIFAVGKRGLVVQNLRLGDFPLNRLDFKSPRLRFGSVRERPDSYVGVF